MKKNKNLLLSIGLIIAVLVVLGISQYVLDDYQLRILNLSGIYIVLALSMNLINGFTGLFSLGHAGFMAIGAYTSVLLTMSPAIKERNFFLMPIVPFLADVQLPFAVALLIGGCMAALVSWLIGAPILRLRDDYLAIATLGFGEIVRVIFTANQSLTNGPLGLKNIESYTTIWWSWGTAIAVIVLVIMLTRSSYGRAFKAIREDEIAAEAMGINLFKHKMMAFIIGSFLAGVGGGLLAHLLGTIDPLMFRFIMTFNILLIVVLGGIGSITGSVLSAVIVTFALEQMRFLDQAITIGSLELPAVPGMRMVVFAALLMAVILFYPKGLMGREEFSWQKLFDLPKNIAKKFGKQAKGGA